MFAKVTNGNAEIYTIGQLRRDNKNVSFPSSIPVDTLAEYNVYEVEQKPKPTYDRKTHTCEFTIEKINDIWTQVWEIKKLPVELAELNIREHRNNLLSNTDWWALSDNNLTTERATYRQNLRDITGQEGFPYNVPWPINPDNA